MYNQVSHVVDKILGISTKYIIITYYTIVFREHCTVHVELIIIQGPDLKPVLPGVDFKFINPYPVVCKSENPT